MYCCFVIDVKLSTGEVRYTSVVTNLPLHDLVLEIVVQLQMEINYEVLLCAYRITIDQQTYLTSHSEG